jgi:sigma-B regulation protein RsbU (phosphoserine phosphatase)
MLGELAVNGLSDANSQMRLNAQVDLVVELLRLEEQITGLEEDLDIMTADFVDTQDQLLALTSLSKSTRHSLDIDETLGLLLRESIRLIRVEGGFITINSGNQAVLVEQKPGQLFSQVDLQRFFEDTCRADDELLLSGDDPFLAKLPDTLSATALLVQTIPIQNNMTVMLGLLLNQPTSKISPYIKLARGIAEYAGAQLENILLYQENLTQAKLKAELALASKIQLQLLPRKAPVVAGLDIAAASRPALQVGGDYYDFLPSTDKMFTFTLGDVSGKGMSAAIVMAMLRTTMRGTTGTNPATTPAQRLKLCNQVMCEDLTDLGMFCTLFVGHYDSVQHRVTYANAGHSPVIYCPRGGAATILQPDAPPVGILPTSLSENHTLSFEPGDLLAIVTDGLNEARNSAGAMFSYERLLQLIEANVEKSAKDISKILFDAVDVFRGEHPQDDDQTLIVIKVGEHER